MTSIVALRLLPLHPRPPPPPSLCWYDMHIIPFLYAPRSLWTGALGRPKEMADVANCQEWPPLHFFWVFWNCEWKAIAFTFELKGNTFNLGYTIKYRLYSKSFQKQEKIFDILPSSSYLRLTIARVMVLIFPNLKYLKPGSMVPFEMITFEPK